MNPPPPAWEARLAALWTESPAGAAAEAAFRARMQALTEELPAGHPVAAYERGGSLDSTGDSAAAVPLYRQALAEGLAGSRRRQCIIQLASSLRNLGQAQESVALLRAERAAGSDDLDDALAGFLALALVDAGRGQEAVSVALTALSRHLTRYQRSLRNYARRLGGEGDR